MEDVSTTKWFSFSFRELIYIPSEFNSWKKLTPTFDKLKELEFEIAQIHFLREVFVAIAVHVAY